MAITLLPVLCNLSYRTRSLCLFVKWELCNHSVSTKTVCICITNFVNVCKDNFFTSLFLPTLVIIPNLLNVFMHWSSRKVKKNIVRGRYVDRGNSYFVSLYRQVTLFYTIYILQREVVARHVYCGMLQTS